ncbi:MAG: proline dehydrogenase family protein [Dehalococcoidia bacterium]|nr:proline dehydrogenase family protein [Dehalococcoidia bacterium]
MATPTLAAALEERTQQLGRALLDEAARYWPGPAERIEDWLLTHAVSDHRFRDRLLRYMDVLAALDHDSSGREAKRLAREYFGDSFPDLPRGLRWLLRLARSEHLPAPVVGETARRSAEVFARRFITPPGVETVTRTIEYLAGLGRLPSFDLLGEAVLSEREADAYVEGYLRLIEQLAAHPSAGARAATGNAALQVSLKLSSLTSHFTPVDPEGSVRRVLPRLLTVAHAARQAGVSLTVDMEQYAYRDLTWEAFQRAFGTGGAGGTGGTGGEFGDWGDVGIVLQGYLRDAPAQAEAYARFALERPAPMQVRLVKGAYWDYETIVAAANRWPAPVLTMKHATDWRFERLLERLIEAPGIRLAVASHNARAHAYAEAVREHVGLPPGAIEHQTLFRTAEGTSRALAALGWSERDYVPVGELLPGMAYLVRRVLENSSQAGFLLQSRAGVAPEDLLRAPREPEPPSTEPAEERASFERAAAAPWHDPAFRARFDEVLARTRREWGTHVPLEAGGQPLPHADTREVFSPSYPRELSGPPVGRIDSAGLEATERAIEVARAGQPAWAALDVRERGAVLRRAAHLLEERDAEFAAWIVHEGGRDRADAFAEVEEAIDYLRYYAAEAERLVGEHLVGEQGAAVRPRGVVGVIPPWNFSLAIPAGMTAAALATGNAAILKPAEQTPLIASRLVGVLHEAGVPRDALVCLPGEGEVVGDRLATDPGVAMVAFTGSRAVGTHLHEVVANVELTDGGVKGLVAEMGGKNAVLVFADADLDEAIEGVIRSAFGHAGQKCSAASRVLVAAPVFEGFCARLVEAARSLEVGPADAPSTRVNPIVSREALERLLEAAARVREEGRVLLDRFDEPQASAPDALLAGPLIVELSAEQALRARTALEELFGPILVVVPFEDEAQAYAIANAVPYALTAGVYSRSPRTIERAARAVEAGTIYVNRPTTGARVAIEPFGGFEFSGTGPKAGGADYLWAFLERSDGGSGATGATGATGDTGSPIVAAEAPAECVAALEGLARRWDAPIEARIEIIERAAMLLGQQAGPRGAVEVGQLFAVAQSARRELAASQPTLQVPGQRTTLHYDVPRGRVLVHGRSGEATMWLGSVLVAGNAALAARTPEVESAARALLEAGVPPEVLALVEASPGALVRLAGRADVDGAVVDADRALARGLARALGPTPDGARGLRALLSPLDGARPGEAGFARRFAWPRVVAVRTLRHGADLAIEEAGDASEAGRGRSGGHRVEPATPRAIR